jgi:hypothetical protein
MFIAAAIVAAFVSPAEADNDNDAMASSLA